MSESTKLFIELLLPPVGAIVGTALVMWFSRLTSLSRELLEMKAELKHLSQVSEQALTEDRAELILNKNLSSHIGDCQNIVLLTQPPKTGPSTI